MPILELLKGNTLLAGLLVVIGFCVWKFIAQPLMNEGEPIEPPEDYKTLTEQMDDAVKTSVDF